MAKNMSIEEAVASIRNKNNGVAFVPVMPVRREPLVDTSRPAGRRRRLLDRETIANGFCSGAEEQVKFVCVCLGTMISFSLIPTLEDAFISAGLYRGPSKKYCEMARRAFQLWRKRVFVSPDVEKLLFFINQHISDHLLEYRQYYNTQAYNYCTSLGCDQPGIMSAHYACFEFVAYAHAVISTMPGLDPSIFDPVQMLRAVWNSLDGLHYSAEREVKWDASPELQALRERMNNTLIQDAVRIRSLMAETVL